MDSGFKIGYKWKSQEKQLDFGCTLPKIMMTDVDVPYFTVGLKLDNGRPDIADIHTEFEYGLNKEKKHPLLKYGGRIKVSKKFDIQSGNINAFIKLPILPQILLHHAHGHMG